MITRKLPQRGGTNFHRLAEDISREKVIRWADALTKARYLNELSDTLVGHTIVGIEAEIDHDPWFDSIRIELDNLVIVIPHCSFVKIEDKS